MTTTTKKTIVYVACV